MKRKVSLPVFAGLLVLGVNAQNPIVPTGKYMADPSAKQWRSGSTVYVYGSCDENIDHYCSKHYDVLSSDDLLNWTMHRDVFSSVPPKDEVPYSDKMLFAPDCVEKDGKYFLYYCMPGGVDDEGTAVSESPVGPFRDGSIVKGISQIDPSVFIDDDGQAYIAWGQFESKMAKLKPNMREIEPGSVRTKIITEKEHFFHEGIQMMKRNGIYYLVYAHIGRRGMATCLGYAMATSPFGPYKYGGVIIDNFGCDPQVWNNHGSIVEINGKWYVFYHRSTEGSVMMRKACVEPITFNPDGTINEVEMTTQGASGPLNPYNVMEAERACYLTGNVRVHCDSNGNEMLDEIKNGDTAAYKYFDFKQSPDSITIKLRSYAGGMVEVFANNLCRPLLSRFNVPSSNGEEITITQKLNSKISGVCPVYFRFRGKDGRLFSMESFVFK